MAKITTAIINEAINRLKETLQQECFEIKKPKKKQTIFDDILEGNTSIDYSVVKTETQEVLRKRNEVINEIQTATDEFEAEIEKLRKKLQDTILEKENAFAEKVDKLVVKINGIAATMTETI